MKLEDKTAAYKIKRDGAGDDGGGDDDIAISKYSNEGNEGEMSDHHTYYHHSDVKCRRLPPDGDGGVAVCGGVTVSKQPKSRNLSKPSENLKTSQNLENIQENNIEEGRPVKIPCKKMLDFNHNSIYSRT